MSPESLFIIFVALAVGSLAKGMVGLGLPTSIAILAVFFGVEHAIVVSTIPVAFANVQIVWIARKRLRDATDVGAVVAAARRCARHLGVGNA